MREIISLHLGEAGTSLGSTCWEVLQLEAQINQDENNKTDMWTVLPDHQPTPKALFVDSDSESLNSLQSSFLGETLEAYQMLLGEGDMGGVYQRSSLRQLAERSMEGVRRLAESSSSVQGFIVFHSLAGGTGTALSEMLLPQLKDQFPQTVIHTLNVFPSGNEKAVAPYNTCLSAHQLLNQSDISFLIDNKALTNIAASVLGIETPTYNSLNQLIAQAYSTLTSSLRYDGCLNTDLREFVTNLVPYPRIHNCMLNYAPYYSTLQPYHSTISTGDISSILFTQSSNLLSCDQLSGLYTNCLIHYRGYIIPKDVGTAICKLKTNREISFASSIPTGFKCGIEYHLPVVISNGDLEVTPRSALAISNNTAIKAAYQYIGKQTEKLFNKKAFLQWYLREGIEEQEVSEAIEDIQSLVGDYREIENSEPDDS